MTRCIAVIGAPHVGKSTLVDKLAGLEGSAPTPTPEESTGLRVVSFEYLNEPWTALDCPGAPEFAQDSLDALMVADAAVVVVSPDPEQAVLAAPALRAAAESGVPTMLFVNRMDEATSRARDIVDALQGYANAPIVLRQIPIRKDGEVIGAVDLISERAWRYRDGGPSTLIEIPAALLDREHEARETLLESLSEYDDWLLEEIIEERTPAEGPLYSICSRALQENKVTEALIGSASHGNGVRRLMKALRHEAPILDAAKARLAEQVGGGDILAVAFGARHRRHVGKMTLLRLFADGLKPGAPIGGGPLGLLVDAGSERPGSLGEVAAGSIVASIKSDHLRRGRVYSSGASQQAPSWRGPLQAQMTRMIRPKSERDDAKLSEALAKLAEDDPSLTVTQAPGSGALVIGAQGARHLRAAQTELAEVFGVETELGTAPADYRETIMRPADTHYRHKKQSGGSGQFADVRLSVAPSARGAGFSFTEAVKGGAVPRNHIPAVEAGARDAMAQGPLGFPVIDVSVTLTDGQHHSVDSSDLAFRIAGRNAVSEALGEADPVLLEPFHAVRFMAPSAYAGALVQIVGAHRGQVQGFDRDPNARGWDAFRALIPASALSDLGHELSAATQGVGRYEASFDHYQELYGREADQIVTARRHELANSKR